ncbi:hypothetical protein BAAA27673_03455 [Bifidobacterium animalis subsp. lactis ATCC 27673]|nr:hypothetical protein BAAA27673_03455 [Bifidobacterium animalis subsp. lactis ATCC 27673]
MLGADLLEEPHIRGGATMVESAGEYRHGSSGYFGSELIHGLERSPMRRGIDAHGTAGNDEMAIQGRLAGQVPRNVTPIFIHATRTHYGHRAIT